ncbi:hypothetical protein GGI21_003665, partial [Coemansia aciculifera]
MSDIEEYGRKEKRRGGSRQQEFSDNEEEEGSDEGYDTRRARYSDDDEDDEEEDEEEDEGEDELRREGFLVDDDEEEEVEERKRKKKKKRRHRHQHHHAEGSVERNSGESDGLDSDDLALVAENTNQEVGGGTRFKRLKRGRGAATTAGNDEDDELRAELDDLIDNGDSGRRNEAEMDLFDDGVESDISAHDYRA